MWMININWWKEVDENTFKNPFTRNFIVSWITWNWKIWYITFFVKDIYSWNKFIYILNLYNFYESTWSIFILIILNWIVAPVLISVLVVFYITPYISLHFHIKHNKNKENESLSNSKINNAKAQEIESEAKKLEAENKKLEATLEKQKTQFEEEKNEYIEKLKKATLERTLAKDKQKTQEEEWENEYRSIINSYWNEIITALQILIYDQYWYTNVYKNATWYNQISSKFESILNSYWLIEISRWDRDENTHKGNYYIITDKWKYFIQRSSLEKE